jgi:hypothetical protein
MTWAKLLIVGVTDGVLGAGAAGAAAGAMALSGMAKLG